MLRLRDGGTVKGWSLLGRSQVIGTCLWIGYWGSSLLLPLHPGHQKVNDFLCVFFPHKAPTSDLKAAEPASLGLESLKVGFSISLCFLESVYFRNFVTTDAPGDPYLDLKNWSSSTGQHLKREYQLLLTWKQLKGKSYKAQDTSWLPSSSNLSGFDLESSGQHRGKSGCLDLTELWCVSAHRILLQPRRGSRHRPEL